MTILSLLIVLATISALGVKLTKSICSSRGSKTRPASDWIVRPRASPALDLLLRALELRDQLLVASTKMCRDDWKKNLYIKAPLTIFDLTGETMGDILTLLNGQEVPSLGLRLW